MANSKMREAIRKQLQRRYDRGEQSDMAYEDRRAGKNIQRDPVTWTVATPEEFREGMQVSPSKRPTHSEPDMNDEQMIQHNVAQMKGKPTGRVKRYDELEQKLAAKIRDADTDEERDRARYDYENMIGKRNNRKRDGERTGFTIEKRKRK